MNLIGPLLDGIARQPVLLVACDYDGTLAEIVSDPAQAHPHREALVALRALSGLPQTHLAVVSGRSLADLANLTGNPQDVHLVGSHGSEFDPGFAANLDPKALELRQLMLAELDEIAHTFTGTLIEAKPAGAAFHYRNAAREDVEAILTAVEIGPASHGGVHVRKGKEVIELSVVATDKGHALETLRQRLGASAAVFIGDDATDEDAFRTLSGPDLGVKVGPGRTSAGARVDGPQDVARLLAALLELRSEWLYGSDATPIEQHALLSDQRTAALVAPQGSITWFCAPRLDSGALFAELLGGPTAGRFSIAPLDGSLPLEQRYLDGTMVLETRWRELTVTDYLDCSGHLPSRRAGRNDLVRRLVGSARVRIEFAPRLDFGRVPTHLIQREGGLEIDGTLDPIALVAPGVRWTLESEGPHHTAWAELALGAAPLALELRYGTGSFAPSLVPETERCLETLEFWSSWTRRLRIPEFARKSVERSALVLRALCHGPSGGIAAAATTSLPEHLGGVRNWDYRFVWLRDAALSAKALVAVGSFQEAMQFLDWVLGVLEQGSGPERLRPLYTLTGAEPGPEAEIADLNGYAGSRPVRVGNAAAQQIQLDVFGPIVDLVASLMDAGAPLSAEHWRLVEAMVYAVSLRWQEPDHGIWEIRDAPRHHVHSKVMCWLTVDRGVHVARHFIGQERDDWKALRTRIAADVLANGWSPSRQSFTAAYGGSSLDAAVLQVGLSGLLEPDDKRFVATVEAVERELRRGPGVYRYLSDDGLPGEEGAFHLCTSWLIDAYLAIGRQADARALFEELESLAGQTGLLSEEIDPESRRALGNHPQAYSHLGLIHNALRLAD